MLRSYSAADVHAALDYPRLIEALRAAFRRDGEPMPLRQAYEVGVHGAPARLLTMPAWIRGEALGVKLVTVFPQNAERGLGAVSSLYFLLDGQTGQPRAMIDGEALTNRRTAAASALASSYLSRADSRTLLIVGSGHVARHLVAAHRAVRPIEKVLVWGRNPQRALELADTLVRQGVNAAPVTDLAVALPQADIVSCATTSTEPLVRGALLRREPISTWSAPSRRRCAKAMTRSFRAAVSSSIPMPARSPKRETCCCPSPPETGVPTGSVAISMN